MKVLATLMMALLPMFASAAEPVWIDVRTAGEFNGGHLGAATNIPHGEVSERVPSLVEDKDTPLYIYCRSGNRAGIAKRALEAEGYTNVKNVGGLSDAEHLFAEMQAQ